MKIIATKNELKAIRDIAENIESGCVPQILKCIDTNPLLERRKAVDNSGEVMLVIDAEYMADALNESSKTIGILWPCLKAAYSAFESYIKTVADLAQNHAKRAAEQNRRKSARVLDHVRNTCDWAGHDHIIKILASNGVTKLSDLPAEVQAVLRNTYPAHVIQDAETELSNGGVGNDPKVNQKRTAPF